MSSSRLYAVLGLVFIGVVSRLIPHPPNFTAMNTIALFGAFCLGSRTLSLVAVLAALFLSDAVLGMHITMPFVYLSLVLTVFLGYIIRDKMVMYSMPLVSCGASLLFFVVTNFGVWLTSGMYEKTVNGLVLCYVAAIPFLGNQMLGDVTYGVLLSFALSYLQRGTPERLFKAIPKWSQKLVFGKEKAPAIRPSKSNQYYNMGPI